MTIFIKKANGRYQVLAQDKKELTYLAAAKTFQAADDYARRYKAYRPLMNQTG